MLLKGLIPVLLLTALAHPTYAQSDKTVLASVTYNISLTQNGQKMIDDVCILDIAKNQSFFYSKNVAETKAKMAAAFEKAKMTNTSPSFNGRDFVINKVYRAYNLKNTDKKQAISIQMIAMQMLGYAKDPELYKNWQITNETTTINGLKCQKAEQKSGALTITAWFCKDIPFQDGPFSYFGLPGLILKLESSDGWAAEMNGITYNKDGKKQLEIVDFALVSEAEMKKAMDNAKAARANGDVPPGFKIEKRNN